MLGTLCLGNIPVELKDPETCGLLTWLGPGILPPKILHIDQDGLNIPLSWS